MYNSTNILALLLWEDQLINFTSFVFIIQLNPLHNLWVLKDFQW